MMTQDARFYTANAAILKFNGISIPIWMVSYNLGIVLEPEFVKG